MSERIKSSVSYASPEARVCIEDRGNEWSLSFARFPKTPVSQIFLGNVESKRR